MSQSPPEPADLPQYHCPACGQLVSAAEASQSLLQCPHCGEQFFSSAREEAEHGEAIEDGHTDAAEAAASSEDAELSEIRIRQIAALRRGAIRTRSWAIIAAGVSVVTAAKLIQMTVVDARLGMRLAPLGDALAAAAVLMIFTYFVRRAIELGREIRASRLQDPASAPDLSTLSDGSQRYRHLEDLSQNQRD